MTSRNTLPQGISSVFRFTRAVASKQEQRYVKLHKSPTDSSLNASFINQVGVLKNTGCMMRGLYVLQSKYENNSIFIYIRTDSITPSDIINLSSGIHSPPHHV